MQPINNYKAPPDSPILPLFYDLEKTISESFAHIAGSKHESGLCGAEKYGLAWETTLARVNVPICPICMNEYLLELAKRPIRIAIHMEDGCIDHVDADPEHAKRIRILVIEPALLGEAVCPVTIMTAEGADSLDAMISCIQDNIQELREANDLTDDMDEELTPEHTDFIINLWKNG